MIFAALLTMQPGEDRVAEALRVAKPLVIELCSRAGVPYPPKRIFIRTFKQERELEIWASKDGKTAFRKLATYPIAGMSGTLGPKRREGDQQVPEGVYFINRFNPQSRFLLSLGLDYPNASDRILSDRAKPGGDIFIHGSDKSIGCLAMTDPVIQQIYVLCLGAKNAGQTKIPVHIFPFRFQDTLPSSEHQEFWKDLVLIYAAFESTKFVPRITIDKFGRYRVTK